MSIPNWSHPNPIFCDFETQSACDIKANGGRAYVEHASTRILILAMCVDEVFHVFIPDYIRVNTDSWDSKSLWPYQIKPVKDVKLIRGPISEFTQRLEEIMSVGAATTNGESSLRPLVAHNAYGFDRGIWNRFFPNQYQWLDTLPLARQAGRNGRLDSLGKSMLGVGKDHAKKLLPKLTTAQKSTFGNGFSYPVINAGDLQAFTRYAVGDVELLRRLWSEFDSIKVEADVIEVHNTINERGIGVDVELLNCIERLSAYSVTQAINEIKELTGGALHEDNIRSGIQVADWLGRYGVSITDDNGKPCLRKEIVQKFIDSPYVLEENLTSAVEIPPITIEVMRLRMKALRITDAKVRKAQNRVSKDGRIRDLHAYHAAHTGRWSSYGVQIHNLPRPKEGAREQVEHLLRDESKTPYVPCLDRKTQDIKLVYDSIKAHIPIVTDRYSNALVPLCTVDDICSALIRPSFRASDGKTFCITDFAQVEARCAAWIADERKMLEAFMQGRDLYKEFASKVFHVELSNVTKDMRQIAKSAVLGCIAEGTPIHTNNGIKPIEQVAIDDLVWDGFEYVKHDGVVFKGERECLELNGTSLTSDHLVLTVKGWREASEVVNGSMKLRSVKYLTDGRLLVKSSSKLNLRQELNIGLNVNAKLYTKWTEAISLLENLQNAESAVTDGCTNRTLKGMGPSCINHTIAKGYLTELAQSFRDASLKNQVRIDPTAVEVFRFTRSGLLTALSFCDTSSPLRDGIIRNLKLIESIMMEITNRETSASLHERYNVITSDKPTNIVKQTYDIHNCGPRRQYQAGNLIAHNCQYGLGANKFRVYAAVNGCDLAAADVTAEQVINAYRDEFTKLAGWKPKGNESFRVGGLWKDLDKACKETVNTHVPHTAGRCRFLIRSKDLIIELPSGRELYYPNARIEDIIPPYCYTMNLPLIPKATVVYDSERGQKSLYGGLLTENICQAICRDIMACCILELENVGMPVVAHVHDEILCEVPYTERQVRLRQMVKIMSTPPDWAEGFPMESEGYTCERFNKSPFSSSYKYDTKELRK